MNIFESFFYIDIGWLILIVFVLNIFGVSIFKTDEKYWHAPIMIWVFLFFAVVLVKVISGNSIQQQELIYSERLNEKKNSKETTSKDADNITMFQVEDSKKRAGSVKNTLFHLLGFQTILCLFLQLIGYKVSGKKMYSSAALTFFFLTIIYLVIMFIKLFPANGI